MLLGHLALGHLLCARYSPNLPLKFTEAGGSKTSCPAVVGGWFGGWPVKMEIRLNSASAEAGAWLSLAKKNWENSQLGLTPPPHWALQHREVALKS